MNSLSRRAAKLALPVAIAALAFSASLHAQIRQTALYIDDGFGNFTILKAPTGGSGGTFTFPRSTLTFPALNAAGVLTNDGTGLLTWGPGGSSNASTLETKTWEAPGTIGSGTPNTGAFTTVTASDSVSPTALVGGGSENYSAPSNKYAAVYTVVAGDPVLSPVSTTLVIQNSNITVNSIVVASLVSSTSVADLGGVTPGAGSVSISGDSAPWSLGSKVSYIIVNP